MTHAELTPYIQSVAVQTADYYIENGFAGYFDPRGYALACASWDTLIGNDRRLKQALALPVQRVNARTMWIDAFTDAYYNSYNLPLAAWTRALQIGGAE